MRLNTSGCEAEVDTKSNGLGVLRCAGCDKALLVLGALGEGGPDLLDG